MTLSIHQAVESSQDPSLIINREVLDMTEVQISDTHLSLGIRKETTRILHHREETDREVNHTEETDQTVDITKIDMEADMKTKINISGETENQKT